jgi:hypothetical protein
MALPANTFRFSLVFALATAGVSAANAQALNQPNPLDRLSDVVQFGVPRDAKFVFCDGEDCPERSIKHLYVPPPPPSPAVQEPVVPAPQSIQPPAELSPAKVPAKNKPIKKKRKKPAVKYECKPVTSAK